MKRVKIDPLKNLAGAVSIPGDKSISHRAVMFSSLARGVSTIENLLEGHDCLATIQVMRSLGVHIALEYDRWIIDGRGRNGLVESSSVLDCKNSGTTIRLMAGLLSAMPFMSILDGTDQIKGRPMDRVIRPLSKMGAKIYGRSDDRFAPLVTLPAPLHGIEVNLNVKSAQVKSALILAGLFASGQTRINNISATRDHSENLLRFMGADIRSHQDSVLVNPLVKELIPIDLCVPGDISSAAFLLVAGVILSEDGLTLRNVGMNKTRTGIIDALLMMGADITEIDKRSVANEDVADLLVKRSELSGATFGGDHIVRMIDEIPVLALAASQASGKTIIRDAGELRHKESDRIAKTVELLNGIGADIEATEDGMIIRGKTALMGGSMSSYHDHRLALMLGIAGLLGKEPLVIEHAEVTDDSFPGFFEILCALGADIHEVLS